MFADEHLDPTLFDFTDDEELRRYIEELAQEENDINEKYDNDGDVTNETKPQPAL